MLLGTALLAWHAESAVQTVHICLSSSVLCGYCSQSEAAQVESVPLGQLPPRPGLLGPNWCVQVRVVNVSDHFDMQQYGHMRQTTTVVVTIVLYLLYIWRKATDPSSGLRLNGLGDLH